MENLCTFKSIWILQLEIINAQCVYSDLGRGPHGHVGLGFSPREYALYSNTVYRKLDHPGLLIIPTGSTLHMSNTVLDQHKERL